MKLKAKKLCIILFTLLCFSRLFALNNSLKGIDLCNSIYSSLKKYGFSPSTQSLVAAGENSFPYNISVQIEGNSSSRDTLVLVFFQEDAASSPALIKSIIKKLSEEEHDFNITILFAYGEKQKIEKLDMIFGTQVFLESISSSRNYTGIVFDLDNDFYGIETSSSGLSSPSWLIQNSCNILMEHDLGKKLPRFFLSQILSYKFTKNRILSAFFENDIPAIILKCNNTETEANPLQQIILESVEKYSKTKNRNWEHHFLMLRLFGRYHTLSESAILKITIPVIFLWIIFISMLFFINTRQKRRAWSSIRKIWYSAPAIYLICIITFFLMRIGFTAILSEAGNPAKIYGIFTAQFIGALFVTELFFILILSLNQKFEVKSIDYLLVICCFINQSIFVLIDISLSPIFIAICFLALIALLIKNDFLHILIFLLMLLLLVPYGNAVIKNSDIALLRQYTITGCKSIFVISLALTPCFIILLRILTSIRSRYKSLNSIITSTTLSFAIISICLIITALVRTKQLNKKEVQPYNILMTQDESDLINISYNDTKIFGDTIRTLDIDLIKECIICDVQINTQSQNPILYTDNDFHSNSENSIRFSIPDYPPLHLSFSYGANPVACRIIVSAVVEDLTDNNYRFITKSIQIGEIK